MSLPYDPVELKVLAVSETGFVFDPRTGHSYSLNATGVAVLTALRDGLALPAIAERVRGEYAGGDAVDDDIEAFVELLRENGLLSRGAT
ncbi:MAG TPA: PqqD family protein [Kofleriaceae bacterium]|jgi:hypothetical protein